MTSGFHRVLLVGCCLCVAQAASAQDRNASRMVDQLVDCRALQDPDKRLACYDRTAEAIGAARAHHDLVVVDREQMRSTHRALFGFSLPKIKLFGGDSGSSGDEEVKQISSTISVKRDVGYGKWTWQLADGSAWQTVEPQQSASRVKQGDAITIKSGILGSYIATAHGDQFKVKRVK